MAQAIKTFLMFDGQAEAALTYYTSLFKDAAAVTDLVRYGAGEAGAEGSVKQASFTLLGQSFMCIDSPAKHAFTFTPAISLFVDCTDEAELDGLFAQLSAGGAIMMPLGVYPFSRKFGWVADRFGVSWQLNLPNG